MEKDNKKIITIVMSIIIILVLVLAISYAYFSTELNGTDQMVKVGTLDLVLDETSEGITLDNAVGISDSEGLSLDGSTFELRNNGNKAVDYTIYLDNNTIGEVDTRIDDKYLKYNLNKNGANSGATLLTRIGANPNRILDSGTIEGDTTNKYSLKLWITDEVDGNYSGQVFSGKLRVEVSQEREKEVATVLLNNIPDDNLYDDGTDTFITGTDPNNYIWYSGKLWRAVSVNNEEKTVKLVTQWNISTISYDNDSSDFEKSYMQEWLNDTTVDGFLGNLRDYENFIVTNAEWNASMMTDNSKPPSEIEGGTIITDAVGLLNRYEYANSYRGTTDKNGYLNNALYSWLLTPYDYSSINSISASGSIVHPQKLGINGIRPSINLISNVKIVSGKGTADNPYRLKGDKDTSLKGTHLNTRYSGEYITFGTGDNNLYRIVSHETEGLTKITSAEPLKNEGSFITTAFGNILFSSTNTIGLFLNGEYLINYLGEEYSNMIEDNTTWYLGFGGQGTNYKLAKYTDKSMSGYATTTTAKVGLLRMGELMSGQFGRYEKNSNYWLLTTYNTSYVLSVLYAGDMNTFMMYSSAIKPSLNLKSNVVITSGDGTLQNPFEIELE